MCDRKVICIEIKWVILPQKCICIHFKKRERVTWDREAFRELVRMMHACTGGKRSCYWPLVMQNHNAYFMLSEWGGVTAVFRRYTSSCVSETPAG